VRREASGDATRNPPLSRVLPLFRAHDSSRALVVSIEESREFWGEGVDLAHRDGASLSVPKTRPGAVTCGFAVAIGAGSEAARIRPWRVSTVSSA
jgi:hypothetical protein